jgi:hypothetical protein
VDSHNDSQVIFYDQLIPGSVLLGYLNADHWAAAVPLNRSHPFISSSFVDKKTYGFKNIRVSFCQLVSGRLPFISSPK